MRIGGALAAVVGIAWLAPLVMEQLVFFGDRDQLAAAEVARESMPLALVPVVAGALAIAVRRGGSLPWLVAAPPAVVVLLAWATPGTAFSILGYLAGAPFALGAAIAGAVPRRHPPLD